MDTDGRSTGTCSPPSVISGYAVSGPHHLEALYDRMLHPTDGRRPLAPKIALEVHLIIRGALKHAANRGLVGRNVALVAHAPKLRSIPKVEPQAWTAQQLQAFLQAAGHRLFPTFWVLATTGMRRSELRGLRWDDVDFKKARVSVNRGLGRSPMSSTSVGARPPTRDELSTSTRPPSRCSKRGINGRRQS